MLLLIFWNLCLASKWRVDYSLINWSDHIDNNWKIILNFNGINNSYAVNEIAQPKPYLARYYGMSCAWFMISINFFFFIEAKRLTLNSPHKVRRPFNVNFGKCVFIVMRGLDWNLVESSKECCISNWMIFRSNESDANRQFQSNVNCNY